MSSVSLIHYLHPHGRCWQRERREGQDERLTVVALLTLGAVTSHVAESTTRVASLRTTTIRTVATVVATLGAVAGNVANLAALVALLSTAGSTEATTSTTLGAFTRKMAGHTAAVARALLLRVRALAV